MPFISHSVKPTEITMGMKGTVFILVLLACSCLMSANTTVSTTAPVPASGDNSAPNVTSTTVNPTSTDSSSSTETTTSTDSSSSTEPTTSTSGQPITQNPATSSTSKITTTPVSSSSTTTTTAPSTTTTSAPSTTTTTAPSTTTNPAPSTTTTSAPSNTTPCPPPSHERHFDFPSFVGGILFTAGAIGLLLLAYKYFGPGRGDEGAYNRIGMKDLYGESENFEL